jgi:predicted transcriptional regulator
MAERKIQRKLASSRRLDRAAALKAIDRGATAMAIAAEQGVSPSTVTRFLHQIREQHQALVEFRARRADVLADLQLRSALALERLLDSLSQIEIRSGIEWSRVVVALRHILDSAARQEQGERDPALEGESALLRGIVVESVKRIYVPAPAAPSAPPAPPTIEVSPSGESVGDQGAIS